MTTAATVTMIVICGLIWGGFAALVVHALRRESGRGERPEESES